MLRSSSTTSTRVSGMAGRQGEREGRAQAGRAPNVDLAAVLLDDHGGPSASPSPVPSDLVEKKGSNTCEMSAAAMPVAGIADRDLERVAANGDGDPQLAALRHRLDGVQAAGSRGSAGTAARPPATSDGRRELAADLQAAGARRGARAAAAPPRRRPPRRRWRSTAAPGRAYSRKFLMMWLSRSDSRATICERRSRASSAVMRAGEDLDRAGERRERVANLVRDVRGHSPERRQTVGLPHPRLHCRGSPKGPRRR